MAPRITRNHEYAKILARTVKENRGFTTLASKVDAIDSADVIQIASGITANSLEMYDTLDSLPTSSLTRGGQGYVKATQRLYVSDSFGWYSAALVNLTPTQTLDPAGNITLATDGTATVVTITAQDSDNPDSHLIYSVESDGNMLATGTTVTQDSSVFTITPLSEDSGGVTGNFTLTFKTTDNVNTATTTKDFSLTIVTLYRSLGNIPVAGNFNDHYIDFTAPTTTGELTVEAWVKIDAGNASGGGDQSGSIISRKGIYTYSGPALFAYRKPTHYALNTFYTDYVGGDWSRYDTNQAIYWQGDQWYHLAFVRYSNNETKLFINGTGYGDGTTYSDDFGGDWRIGKSGASYTYKLVGDITDFAWSSVARYDSDFSISDSDMHGIIIDDNNTVFHILHTEDEYTNTAASNSISGGPTISAQNVPIIQLDSYSQPWYDGPGLGDSRWFIDEFTTNTTSSSEYAITNTSTAATWNNSGYIYFNTGDNHSSEIEWTPSDGQPLRSEGRVFAVFQKTRDWPSDNASDIYLKHSNGTDYYKVRYAGSAYQSNITKTVSSSVTDTQNISYNFDDQSSYHTFELQWSSDTIKFYVDGTLQGTLTPSNNTTPIEISSVNFFFTQIQGPLTAIGYQDYGSDASAHPFIS